MCVWFCILRDWLFSEAFIYSRAIKIINKSAKDARAAVAWR